MLSFRHLFFGFGAAATLLAGQTVDAQQHVLSINDVIHLIETGQPQLHAFKEVATATAADIDLARNTVVPNLTAGYQADWATDNNITGMSYPGLLMPISGPVAAQSSNNIVPGTALVAYLQWTPLTFGQRAAAVEKAVAAFQLSGTAYDKALFQQWYYGIITYISILYLQKLLHTEQANIDRTRVGLRQSLELAKQGLRPGLDTVQFQSLLSQAVIERLRTLRFYNDQVLELCRLTNYSGRPEDIVFSDTALALRLPALPDTSGGYTQHPAYRYYQAQVGLSAANLKEIERGWRPRLDVWANAYSRGSGISPNGVIDRPDGWALSRTNYGAGLQLSFPILEFSRVNIQKRQYRSRLAADRDQLAQVDLDLRRQVETAESNYVQDVLLAQEAPVLSRAALLSFEGLTLSYQNGLVDFTRLTQGQYQLLQAEMTEADANLQVWRALLDISVAKGNLHLFTDQLK